MPQPDDSAVHEYELLTVTWHASEQPMIVAVAGEIDMDNADQLAHELTSAQQATSQPLIIDMAGVSFLASVGIQALIRQREAAGYPISLRNLQPGVRRVLDIAGVLDLFHLAPAPSTKSGQAYAVPVVVGIVALGQVAAATVDGARTAVFGLSLASC